MLSYHILCYAMLCCTTLHYTASAARGLSRPRCLPADSLPDHLGVSGGLSEGDRGLSQGDLMVILIMMKNMDN